MNCLDVMKQALEALEHLPEMRGIEEAIKALRLAIEQEEAREAHWLTKELMADYIDLIAEAIEDNRSEMLRHKAHWMRVRGEA